jgi:hypothetical protein
LGSNALAKGYQEKQCTGAVKVIASIEDPAVIRQILGHLQNRTESPQPRLIRPAHRPHTPNRINLNG